MASEAGFVCMTAWPGIRPSIGVVMPSPSVNLSSKYNIPPHSAKMGLPSAAWARIEAARAARHATPDSRRANRERQLRLAALHSPAVKKNGSAHPAREVSQHWLDR